MLPKPMGHLYCHILEGVVFRPSSMPLLSFFMSIGKFVRIDFSLSRFKLMR